MPMIHIRKLGGFINWFDNQTAKFQSQIEKRLDNIEEHAHYGLAKDLGGGIGEIKFNNGVRIYFAKTGPNEITLLLGGNKNGQDKDIKKARSLLS